MKNLESLSKVQLEELSQLEQYEINGGQEMVTFRDSQGYTWFYTYNDAGALTSISVLQQLCK